MLLSATLLSSACTSLAPPVSLDGSDPRDLARLAVLRPSDAHPLVLRGLDGAPLDTLRSLRIRTPTYVVAPGTHTFRAVGAPYPHPLLPQRLRCYVIEVRLEAGQRYVIGEDPEREQAFVAEVASGRRVATGVVVDKPFVFQRDCRWH